MFTANNFNPLYLYHHGRKFAKTLGRSFTELEAWRKARVLKKRIRQLTIGFPAEEKFRLTDQLIRSSRSISANIAEGHGRYAFPDQIHFCIQARGSLSETYNHCIDAYDENLITKEILLEVKSEINECERLLNGYISWLRKEHTKTKKHNKLITDHPTLITEKHGK